MESIQGLVEHIVYHNDTNGYTVFSLMCQGEEIVCVGNITSLDEGEYLKAEGEYTEHQVYGRQFKVTSMSVEVPEDEYSIERYLGSGAIRGVGPSLAARIVKKFKKDSFRIIEEEPERLAEIKGISERKAREIYQQFHEKQDMRQAMMFLAKYGITTTLSLRIYKQYGEEMYRIIQENPYRLADDMNGIGFKLADEIAKKAGIGSHSDFRIRSGIIYMLQQGTLSGHIYIPAALLVEKTAQMLGVEEEAVDHLLQSLQMDRKIVVKKIDDVSVVYGASLYRLELETAGLLKNLGVDYSVDEKEVGKVLDRIEKREGIDLDDHQREAVYSAAGNGVLVITGGPGTGKTTTINAIIKYLEYEGLEMRLAAPTGRAAKRMSEATGREAQTIHRMLELSGGPDDDRLRTQFERNQDNPLETDVVIIDEMSMVDIYLMNALLKAIAVGTRLILVGDVNQLPSVGPGNVLKDIIDSECFQVVRLTKIFRQALESDIIKNAHLINEGLQIELGNKSQDFFCLKRYDVQQILGVMVLLIRDKLPKFVNARPYDIQVLTPMRKGELGVERLNIVLQHYLNPPSPDKKEREFHQGVIREGDKVMQIRNNYQIEWEVLGHYNLPLDKGVGVFNGDMGVVREINHFAEQLVVEFDEGRRVTYGFAQLDELELAYAITIHKSQGSEYPAVIMPLLSGPRMLFNRNILYTAVTRAKQCVAIVGDEHTVRHMIENEKQQKRYTSLNLRLREMNTLS